MSESPPCFPKGNPSFPPRPDLSTPLLGTHSGLSLLPAQRSSPPISILLHSGRLDLPALLIPSLLACVQLLSFPLPKVRLEVVGRQWLEVAVVASTMWLNVLLGSDQGLRNALLCTLKGLD